MLAQSEKRQDNSSERYPKKKKPLVGGDGMRILDPTAIDFEQQLADSRSSRYRTVVMSPLPQSSRTLFGEGSRKFTQEPPGPSCRSFLQGWSPGQGPMGTTKWQACDACGHTCWGG